MKMKPAKNTSTMFKRAVPGAIAMEEAVAVGKMTAVAMIFSTLPPMSYPVLGAVVEKLQLSAVADYHYRHPRAALSTRRRR